MISQVFPLTWEKELKQKVFRVYQFNSNEVLTFDENMTCPISSDVSF